MSRVVVVTGASGAIGAATAARFAAEGDRVWLVDVRAAALADRIAELRRALPGAAVSPLELDVRDRGAIERAHAQIVAADERVDVLVNSAGVFGRRAFLELDDAEIDAVVQVNLLGTLRVSQVFARGMVARGAGRIVHVGSVAALRGASHAAHYAASKGAIAALGRSMALELGAHGVQVNVVHPGYIDTEMLGPHRQAISALARWRVPEKRLGRPEEVAEAIWMLASARSTFLLGAELVVDGGLSLG